MRNDSTDESLKLKLWFALACGPANKYACSVLSAFDYDAESIYKAKRSDFDDCGCDSKTADALANKDLEEAESILDFCTSKGVGLLTYDSPMYPARLRRIQNPPMVLYYRGILADIESNVCIATVGTRKMSDYGLRTAYSIAYDIARAGGIVVSGLAKGIDGVCQRGCLDAGGFTVGVLGCGIDRVYPAENLDLMREAVKHGIVMTEYKPGTPPEGKNFPQRNRIISGLCQGTAVIEAGRGSGALITARYALSQGRDVFALPGEVGELNSYGTNELIKNGAKIITCAADILGEYEALYPGKINLAKTGSVYSEKHISPIPETKKIASGEEKPQIKSAPKGSGEVDTAKRKTGIFSTIKKKISKPKESESGAPEQNSFEMPKLDPSEQAMYDAMSDSKPMTADEISKKTGLHISEVLVCATLLEIKHLIEAVPGGMYAKIKH